MIPDRLFIEKYRPKEIDDFICDDDIKIMIEGFVEEPWSIPHILVSTKSPGTGKTSFAKMIIYLTNADYLYLNASDERGIDVIRKKVKEFAITRSMNSGAPKIIHLDESDGLTKDAQNILRSIMEEYIDNCRFILTANNYSKLIEPLRSRCLEINFGNPPKEKIFDRLFKITVDEDLDLEDDELNSIIEAYYPDIRSMVKTLDNYYNTGILNLETQNDIANTIYNHLLDNSPSTARKYWIQKNFNYSTVLKTIFNKIWEDRRKLKKELVENCISIIAEGEYRMIMGADPEIIFTDTIFKLSKEIDNKYK